MADRVLVVDDGVMNRQILASILRKAGLECLLAGDGSEALRAVRESRPDLVLLDVVMPGKDGYEVCAEIKADPETADIPVVVVTADARRSQEERVLAAGAAAYAAKPVDVRRFMRTLDSALGG
jgi:CheY-like chemotaxis protein